MASDEVQATRLMIPTIEGVSACSIQRSIRPEQIGGIADGAVVCPIGACKVQNRLRIGRTGNLLAAFPLNEQTVPMWLAAPEPSR
jgi:hypothetical protein